MTLYDPELEVGTRLERCLIEVGSERKRQERLKADGRFKYTCADAGMDPMIKLACIQEEVGEVARSLLVRDGLATDDIDVSDPALRKELCQIAALAVAWMESL